GFDNTLLTTSTIAARPIDFSNNINTMYIYCDAVQYNIIGDAKANILACIPAPPPSDFGRVVMKSFQPVHYIPVARDCIDAIKIEILDQFGRPMQFNFGTTIVTLHIKTIDK
ncbi:unnamed protein product, partial [Auanema sp. JU1783]